MSKLIGGQGGDTVSQATSHKMLMSCLSQSNMSVSEK